MLSQRLEGTSPGSHGLEIGPLATILLKEFGRGIEEASGDSRTRGVDRDRNDAVAGSGMEPSGRGSDAKVDLPYVGALQQIRHESSGRPLGTTGQVSRIGQCQPQ